MTVQDDSSESRVSWPSVHRILTELRKMRANLPASLPSGLGHLLARATTDLGAPQLPRAPGTTWGKTAGGVASDPNLWTVERLRKVIAEELAGTDVILVSNREPYVHTATEGAAVCDVPVGGLVSALEPVARSCGGTWIAHGSGSADRQTVDADDRIAVPPWKPEYTLRRVWLSPEEERGYYSGFANEGLWPLCHTAFVRPMFRETDWNHYRAVNERFAEAVRQEARSETPIVIVQDYHFALLPRMIRARLPKATILSFWHIPWPNAEVFGICPYAAAIVDGLLGSDIVGFQVPLFRMNFTECVERTLESRINREDWSVRYGGTLSRLRTYPISIDWGDSDTPAAPASPSIRDRFNMRPGAKLVVGVGRLDYTKGIPEFLSAYELLLQRYPDWQGKVHLYYVAAPSRSEVAPYRALQEECRRLARRINDRFGTRDYLPLEFVDRHVHRVALRDCYGDTDICAVPSLHDGMNLVAKEFVAARGNDDGVLILSRFAGAIQELPEALSVNPFDVSAMAETLNGALQMSPGEQAERMRRMRDTVRSKNIFRWAGRLLSDAAHYRGRSRLLRRTDTTAERPVHGPRSGKVGLPDDEKGNDAETASS
ncbi:trehalose-6-phosphate synthase [Frigidibacter sp. SD6-1]|uniref:alpha,alpha-trehalose-phosphate synthase (UDP-forming) n=1 Tax=Frigidibacter sp. SD6-1 TaxID=3032581 RepID=UPI0024DFA798|nr:trehalose-6-phosphate synthase [Frigidibacter sp. SD6-1]